ncbi:MAG: hypothetical protein ACREVO_08300 [Steroidobacteraceae bacterium]
MTPRRICLIHTAPLMVQVFTPLCRERLSMSRWPRRPAGDTETHDMLVCKAILNKLPNVDVIVLAQVSMARVVDRLPPEALIAPVLSSPGLAMDYVGERLARLRPN